MNINKDTPDAESDAYKVESTQYGTRICTVCQSNFVFALTPGRYPEVCSIACREQRRIRGVRKRRANLPACSVAGCKNRMMYLNAGMCQRCYFYSRRNPHLDPVANVQKKPKYRYIRKDGYVLLISPGHELADKQGQVSEHRMVVWNQVGSGKQACHWCACDLDWASLVIDHLNEIRSDNRIENLVVSCERCNILRGALAAFSRVVLPVRLDEAIGLMKYIAREAVSGCSSNDPASPTIDHVVPLAKGGKHSYANCRTAHAICNSLKGDM